LIENLVLGHDELVFHRCYTSKNTEKLWTTKFFVSHVKYCPCLGYHIVGLTKLSILTIICLYLSELRKFAEFSQFLSVSIENSSNFLILRKQLMRSWLIVWVLIPLFIPFTHQHYVALQTDDLAETSKDDSALSNWNQPNRYISHLNLLVGLRLARFTKFW
jgi:hypothetical protein